MESPKASLNCSSLPSASSLKIFASVSKICWRRRGSAISCAKRLSRESRGTRARLTDTETDTETAEEQETGRQTQTQRRTQRQRKKQRQKETEHQEADGGAEAERETAACVCQQQQRVLRCCVCYLVGLLECLSLPLDWLQQRDDCLCELLLDP